MKIDKSYKVSLDPDMYFEVHKDEKGRVINVGFKANLDRFVSLADLYELKTALDYVIGEAVRGEDNHEVE